MDHRRMTISAFLAAAVIASPLAGGTTQAQEKKTTTQVVKTAVTDSWVTAKTKISLFADERVKGTQVRVETKDGLVYLHGKVDSSEAKSAAGEIARGIEGAKTVKNDLQVVPPAARKAVDVSDKEITKQVEATLARDAELKKVDVRTDAGLVTLKGEVPTIVASAKASETARSVPGVRSVRNELTFQQ